MINIGDKAMNSRYCLFPFKELALAENHTEDPNLMVVYKQYEILLSACMPDFASILWEGKLDRVAIQDCSKFLCAVIGVKRDRNLNM